MLEGELTYEEMVIAINQMENGTSPGLDGIGIEFYKKSLNTLAEIDKKRSPANA